MDTALKLIIYLGHSWWYQASDWVTNASGSCEACRLSVGQRRKRATTSWTQISPRPTANSQCGCLEGWIAWESMFGSANSFSTAPFCYYQGSVAAFWAGMIAEVVCWCCRSRDHFFCPSPPSFSWYGHPRGGCSQSRSWDQASVYSLESTFLLAISWRTCLIWMSCNSPKLYCRLRYLHIYQRRHCFLCHNLVCCRRSSYAAFASAWIS